MSGVAGVVSRTIGAACGDAVGKKRKEFRAVFDCLETL
jgi:hypothetical protein